MIKIAKNYMMFILVISAFFAYISRAEASSTETKAPAQTCWKDSYGRGIGTVPSSCGDLDKSGLLCYPACPSGYNGVGPVCWRQCPSGWVDTGLYCQAKAYSLSAYTWQKGDELFSDSGQIERCEKASPEGCDKCGTDWFPKCDAGYERAIWPDCAQCVQSSTSCPSGMKFVPVLGCAKDSSTRKTILPQCAPGQENDAGLCYESCKTGYKGLGPVCWGQCPASMPTECAASCAVDTFECAADISNQVMAVLSAISKTVELIETAGASATVEEFSEKLAEQMAKAAAKELIRVLVVQLGISDKLKLKAKLADELSQVVDPKTAQEIADLFSQPESFQISSLDPTGISGAISAFKQEICQ